LGGAICAHVRIGAQSGDREQPFHGIVSAYSTRS
jgi:hypothetical protein